MNPSSIDEPQRPSTEIALSLDVPMNSAPAQESLQTMQSVQQMRTEQAKILQAFNTPSYTLMVRDWCRIVMSRSLARRRCCFMSPWWIVFSRSSLQIESLIRSPEWGFVSDVT